MNITKNLLATFIILSAGTAIAAETTSNEKIIKTAYRDSGIHSVFLENALVNTATCTLSDRFVFAESSAGGEAMVNAVLTASLNNKNISARVDGCLDIGDGNNTSTAPKAVSIIIETP